jgi:hypothetical protein
LDRWQPGVINSVNIDEFWAQLVEEGDQPPSSFENDDSAGGFIIPVGNYIVRVQGVAPVSILPVGGEQEHVHDRRTIRLNRSWRVITCTRCRRP